MEINPHLQFLQRSKQNFKKNGPSIFALSIYLSLCSHKTSNHKSPNGFPLNFDVLEFYSYSTRFTFVKFNNNNCLLLISAFLLAYFPGLMIKTIYVPPKRRVLFQLSGVKTRGIVLFFVAVVKTSYRNRRIIC
jgi:hypothetical protein